MASPATTCGIHDFASPCFTDAFGKAPRGTNCAHAGAHRFPRKIPRVSRTAGGARRAGFVAGCAGWEPAADWPAGTRLNDRSLHRLMEGLRLLEGLPEAKLVVSGGSRRADEAPVAQGYAAAAQALGVNPERIVVLDMPTDTAQEAYAVREFLGTEARFVLVTSASHMPRAVRHFERVGLSPIAAPAHYLTGRDGPDRLRYWVPSSDALRKTERAVYEYLGLRALELDHRPGTAGCQMTGEPSRI